MDSRKLGLDKGGRADHRARREAFAVKFWERERESTGTVPQPENYTSSFIRRARGGVVVGTRVSRADSPSPGVWCCISGRSTAPSANIRKAVRTEREGKQTQRSQGLARDLKANETVEHLDPGSLAPRLCF